MNDDRIDYSGLPGEFNPSPGSGINSSIDDGSIDTTHYADLDYLQNQLVTLLQEVKSLLMHAEDTMSTRAIEVDVDDRLVEANTLEWPSTLGDPRNKVSYRYYKALRVRDTTSAYYIRKRYEEAARDVAGNNAIDIIALAGIIQDEALLVQEFLSDYVGNVDDAAEYRTIELFQDWTISALGHTRQLRAIFEAGGTAQSSANSSLGVSSEDEAKQSQVVFKIKLNSTNDVITRAIDSLRKNYAEFASVFYNKFLGPGLTVRLGVSRKTFPIGSGVAAEVDRAAATLDSNLESVLADQMRRNMLFNDTLTSLESTIVSRDSYRDTIHQLAEVGKNVPSSGAGILVSTQDTEDEVQHFDSVEASTTLPSFGSPHSALGSLSADDHPQYFQKAGGEITGDVTLAEGVKVDGMSPSTHHHTGQDGTEQIHAGDLLPGSLRVETIDGTDKPARPTQLRVVNQDIEVVPPGVSQLNVIIQWLGEKADDLYEVEFVPIAGGGELKLPQ